VTDACFVSCEEGTELSRNAPVNVMLKSVKGNWVGLFDGWKMRYEFTSIIIKKILKMFLDGKDNKVIQEFSWKA
jgi:hypothetical protein